MTTKYRAEVTGIGENVWSTNALEYDRAEDAVAWLRGLATRWTGFDASRVVTTDTPEREPFDPSDKRIVQNWKRMRELVEIGRI